MVIAQGPAWNDYTQRRACHAPRHVEPTYQAIFIPLIRGILAKKNRELPRRVSSQWLLGLPVRLAAANLLHQVGGRRNNLTVVGGGASATLLPRALDVLCGSDHQMADASGVS